MTVMAFFSNDIRTIDDLFVNTLRDIYYAEKQILEALPEMIGKAASRPLRRVLQSHLKESRDHLKQLEQVFRLHGAKPKHVDCPAIDGLLEEAIDIDGKMPNKRVIDSALIAAAHAIEHFEIARYRTLVAWARELGRDDCASVLQHILEDETAIDQKLRVVSGSKPR